MPHRGRAVDEQFELAWVPAVGGAVFVAYAAPAHTTSTRTCSRSSSARSRAPARGRSRTADPFDAVTRPGRAVLPPHARALRLLPEDLRHRPLRGAALPPLRTAERPPRRPERRGAHPAGPPPPPPAAGRACPPSGRRLAGRPPAAPGARRALGVRRGRRPFVRRRAAGVGGRLRSPTWKLACLQPAEFFRVGAGGRRLGGALRRGRHDDRELVPDALRSAHGAAGPRHDRGDAAARSRRALSSRTPGW